MLRPVFFANRAFEGTNLYTAEDMPDIDYLLISHDHWDHLDYATATALRSKVGQVVCPLGVGAHFVDARDNPRLQRHDNFDKTELQIPQ